MDSSQENRKKRKGRGDTVNRDFICPCGKSYLSYPALFTHVKQKHNGKPPGELIKPKSENVKRGRPRSLSITTNLDEQNTDPQQLWIKRVKSALALVTSSSDLRLAKGLLGSSTCEEILRLFWQEASTHLCQQEQNNLSAFLYLVRESVNLFFEEDYAQTHNAMEIIDCTNDLVNVHFQTFKDSLHFPKEVVILLVKTLFQWLYLRKFTDHVLWENLLTKDSHQEEANQIYTQQG